MIKIVYFYNDDKKDNLVFIVLFYRCSNFMILVYLL